MTTVRPAPRQGIYETPFWAAVAEGALALQHCRACGAWWYPPGPSCPDCLAQDYEWAAVAGRGRLLSWAVFRRQYFPSLPPPYTIVAVELEEGPILITDLAEAEGAPLLALDLAMELCYEPAETPSGDPFTIYRFRVAERHGVPA